MEQLIYAIRDDKADAFMRPFFVLNEGMAIRAFTNEVNDPQQIIGKNPEDYALFQVGIWNEQHGVIVAMESPRCIVNGISALRVKE